LDAEPPVQEFASSLTPNSRFFVRYHFGPPPAELLFDPNWRLSVGGMVDRPLTFMLKELKQCEEVAVTAVVQCSRRRVLGDRPDLPPINQVGSGVRIPADERRGHGAPSVYEATKTVWPPLRPSAHARASHLSVDEQKWLNELTEEAIRDLLKKYRDKSKGKG
jgi:DMSO/TMAO reductase YedYZ molybdopterin-dependent catalytic subunit